MSFSKKLGEMKYNLDYENNVLTMQITSGEHWQYWSAMSALMSIASTVSRISLGILKKMNFPSAAATIERASYNSRGY